MLSGMFSSSWIVPFYAQPFAFGTLNLAIVANSTEPTIIRQSLANVKLRTHILLFLANVAQIRSFQVGYVDFGSTKFAMTISVLENHVKQPAIV
jgi:hypothetical protein